MAIRRELIDELIATSGGSLIGPDGLVKELTKALVERMLEGRGCQEVCVNAVSSFMERF